MIELLAEELIELVPGCFPTRVPMDLGEGDEPRLLACAEPVDGNFEAITLNVYASREHANSVWHLGCIVLGTRQNVIRLHGFTSHFPGLAKNRVHPGLEAEWILL